MEEDPTARAVYRKDACGISSAEGWQVTPDAAKMALCWGEWSQEGQVPLWGVCVRTVGMH